MQRGRYLLIVLTVAMVIVTGAFWEVSFAGSASPPPKPKLISMATFDVGGNTYVAMASIAEAIWEKFGVKLRVVPIGNSVARAIATRGAATQLWGSCSAYYACAEGVFDFGTLEWGPQPLQALYICNRKHNFSPATTKDSGIKTMADVKGKKVAYVVGNPTINLQVRAFLAFAGLTTDDVELVKFPGYTASLRGLLAGKVDMALSGAGSTRSYEIEASPRGLYWIPIPHSDVDGWKRLQDIAPFVAQLTLTRGAGASPQNPVEAGTYPCPVIVAWERQDEGVCYWMTKMVAESWELYKDKTLSGVGLQMKEFLAANPSVPFHAGTVRYLKEENLWSAEKEKRQQYLLKRQKLLADAFAAARDEFLEKKLKVKQFPDFWEKKRAAALKAAGLPVL